MIQGQRRIIYASFMFFALTMEQNKEVSDEFKRYFKLLAVITRAYKRFMEEDVDIINNLTKKYENGRDIEIDYVLASISLISLYYDMTKGKKRYFKPMTYNAILELQDEIIEDLEKTGKEKQIKETFDLCDYLAKELLCE